MKKNMFKRLFRLGPKFDERVLTPEQQTLFDRLFHQTTWEKITHEGDPLRGKPPSCTCRVEIPEALKQVAQEINAAIVKAYFSNTDVDAPPKLIAPRRPYVHPKTFLHEEGETLYFKMSEKQLKEVLSKGEWRNIIDGRSERVR